MHEVAYANSEDRSAIDRLRHQTAVESRIAGQQRVSVAGLWDEVVRPTSRVCATLIEIGTHLHLLAN